MAMRASLTVQLLVGSNWVASGYIATHRSSPLIGWQRHLSVSPRRMTVSANPNSFFSDDEWHPHDPAETTPQLMHGIWDQIAQAGTMTNGESMTVVYPNMAEQFATPRFLNLMLAHLDVCKDVCDHFGMTTMLMPYQQEGKVTGFTVKSLRNPDKDDYDFAYDPFWDDGTDFDNLYTGIDEEEGIEKDPYPEIVNKIPDDDDVIIDTTKAWVGRMMTDMGLCPFTAGPEKAGLPIGNVYYCVDRCTNVEDMYARYWLEVVRVENHSEKDLSTTLLVAPNFLIDNVELFESFTNTLTQALTGLGTEDLLQLVFFHPQWSFRDGGARSGEGQAANYARRSPWPMINLLRTKQVRAAQKGIPTGLVYKQNEKTLANIGVDKLETMLRLRDWQDIADMKVNRREIDALMIAQDYQATGTLQADDTSLAADTTPAAHKADPAQMEKGDLVKVLLQALEKRLGKHGPLVPLSGPETSATALATDFLMKELQKITTAVSASAARPHPEMSESDMLRQRQRELARQALMDDFEDIESSSDRGDVVNDVLFGRGGVKGRSEDEDFQEGMNPNSFY